MGKREIVWKHDARRAGISPTSTSVEIIVCQYGKSVLYFFYDIAIMSKAQRIRNVNTAVNQSAFRTHTCYIIIYIRISGSQKWSILSLDKNSLCSCSIETIQ